MSTLPDFEQTRQVEERVEDIYATRSFLLSNTWRNWALEGLSFRQPILPGINEAQCGVDPSRVSPSADCSCGFYCYDEEDGKLWGSSGRYRGDGVSELLVDAIVRVSGRIVVHASGLRAQNLEVVAFVTENDFARDKLGELFPRVPLFDFIEDALQEFPITKLPRNDLAPAGGLWREVVLSPLAACATVIASGVAVSLSLLLGPLDALKDVGPANILLAVYCGVATVMMMLGLFLKKCNGKGLEIMGRTLLTCGYILGFSHIILFSLSIFDSLEDGLLIASFIIRAFVSLVLKFVMFIAVVFSLIPGSHFKKRPQTFSFAAKTQDDSQAN